MGFLKNIFKKKPGGTMFGNLLRGASSAATGGVLGQGLNKIELGQTQTNKQLAVEASKVAGTAYVNPTITALQGAASGVLANAIGSTPQIQSAVYGVAEEKAKQNWFTIVMVAVAGALGFLLLKEKKGAKF